MKIKPFKILFTLLLLLPLLLWMAWLLQPKKELRLFVLDKTVLTPSVQEHLSLFWVLNNQKYVHDSKAYLPNTDYAGFFPDGKGKFAIKGLEGLSKDGLRRLADQQDLVVYTDLYGIYANEWREMYATKGNDSRLMSERSPLLYGGMQQNDLDFLLLMQKRGKLIVTEFNTIASPTSDTIRRQFENAFGMRWSGWIGRYFDVLDTLKNRELPEWLIRNYVRQHQGKWPFHRSGVVFVNQNDEIVVLENKTHLTVELPQIESAQQVVRRYGMKATVNYPFWFDVVTVRNPNHVLSFYHLRTTSIGDSVLKSNGLPNVFPALIHAQTPAPFYYMAGDFSDNPLGMTSSYFEHVNWFPWLFYSSSLIERKNFFWQYYQPFMKTTLSDYYQSLKR